MKRTICGFIAAIVILCFAGAGLADGIPGATDKVTAATLLVPFFEVGVNNSTHPIDTLLNLNNVNGNIKIHYHVWDIDGNAVGLYGNMDVPLNGSWSASMRTLISLASTGVKDALSADDPDYYRGFVTIDVVTADTTMNPHESGYPFGTSNCLSGYIYYVRLTEGSSNSMTMIPLEQVGTSINNQLRGFYRSTDDREEIDVMARACAAALTREEECDEHENIHRVYARVFLDPLLNATTRIIIFLWNPYVSEGISDWCDSEGCDTDYTYHRYSESGTLVENTTVSLDHVVNVIDVSGTENGWVSIRDIPGGYGGHNWQVYAFSITNANPSSGASNWDAITEAIINP